MGTVGSVYRSLLPVLRDGRCQNWQVQLHNPDVRHFASDNYAGAHPEVLAAIAEANGGHQVNYGGDVYTERLHEVIRDKFGQHAEVFPVFNGTGANVVALTSMLPRWGGVIAASTAHINTDENAAPERIGGIKLLTVDSPDGKLTPDLIDLQASGRGDEHRAEPLVVSITQSTEVGTVYTPDELRAICDHAHSLGMRVHVDGSRISNAAASLGVSLRDLTTSAGVDMLSLGGTKNGLLYGEAVVVLSPEASVGLPYLRKYMMQLSSKMRFASAQMVALFEDDLWLRSAQHSNAMSARLRARLDDAIAAGTASGLRFTQPTLVNSLFAVLPAQATARLRETHHFYDWNPSLGEVRWMTTFDTTEDDVDRFAADIITALGQAG